MTDAADCSETSCSPERPPYRTATRSFFIRSEIRVNVSPDSLARHQLPQHKGQNPAVLVVVDLDRCIDSQLHGNAFSLSILARDLERDHLPRLDRVGHPRDSISLRSVQPERLRVGAFDELHRQYTHAN